MTKSAHFGSNSSFGLSKAILVYSDGQQLFRDDAPAQGLSRWRSTLSRRR
jgi:hypothetical protein